MKPKKEYVLKLSDFERRLLIGLMTQVHNVLLRTGKPTEDVAQLLRHPGKVFGVALHHGAAHMVDHRLPEFRLQEILISLLTGVNLYGHLTGKVLVC